MEATERNQLQFPSRFTSISDSDLEQQVAGIKAEFENGGERMVIGILRATGVHVPRHRVSDIIRRIDPINTALRWRAMHPRYQYDCFRPCSSSNFILNERCECATQVRLEIKTWILQNHKENSIMSTHARQSNFITYAKVSEGNGHVSVISNKMLSAAMRVIL